MSSTIMTILLWTAAVSSGLIAGVYFAFSGFIMQSFSKLNITQSIAAMNSINKVILRSLFMPLFFGSTIASVLLIIFSLIHWSEAGSLIALVAGATYFFGMFVCTVMFNVPLNNSLAGIDHTSTNAPQIWSHYLKTWTNWNHLRMICSIVTCILCIWVLSNQ